MKNMIWMLASVEAMIGLRSPTIGREVCDSPQEQFSILLSKMFVVYFHVERHHIWPTSWDGILRKQISAPLKEEATGMCDK